VKYVHYISLILKLVNSAFFQSQPPTSSAQHPSTSSSTNQPQQLTHEAQHPVTQQQQQQQQQQHTAATQPQHLTAQHQHVVPQPNHHQQQPQGHQASLFNSRVGPSAQNSSPFVHPGSTTQFPNGSRLPHPNNQTEHTISRGQNEQYTMQPTSMHYQTQSHYSSSNFPHPIHTLHNAHHTPNVLTSTPTAQTSLTPSVHPSLSTSNVYVTSSPAVVQGSSTVSTTSNIPPSLVNFQVDPDTGLPLSIINLQNGGMLKSTPVPQPVSENIDSRDTPSGMLLTSRDPVLSAGPFMSESSTSNTPTQPLTVNVSSSASPPLISPSLMSPGLLSPTRQYSLLSPSELKKSSQLGAGLNGLGSVKLSLLLDPTALPQPPALPQLPCPVEKLSPPTPSIRVSTCIRVVFLYRIYS
jgi:hypothetical protein